MVSQSVAEVNHASKARWLPSFDALAYLCYNHCNSGTFYCIARL